MSITWTHRAQRAVRQYGLNAAILAAGTAVAIGTINRPTQPAQPTLVERLAATAPSAVSAAQAAITARSAASAEPRLDAGIEHSRIDYWVQRLTAMPGFDRLLARKDKYEQMITAKLDAKDLPRDLIYLAMIESNFNPTARSQVSAVGLWQFMSATARQFGLRVGKGIDERKNPELATEAAAVYLAHLYDRFGSWYLAAAAYNSGPGTVRKALRKVTGKTTGTDADFFLILSSLPQETQDYVPKLIAATRIGNDPARYGMGE